MRWNVAILRWMKQKRYTFAIIFTVLSINAFLPSGFNLKQLNKVKEW